MAKFDPADKPAKPYSDFPLFAHASGRWCKKIRGKFVYFGPWGDPDAALNLYLRQRDDLHGGRKPPTPGEKVTIKDVFNRFLDTKLDHVESGELSLRTWRDYRTVCERVADFWGRSRAVAGLSPVDFAALRSHLTKSLGLAALSVDVQRIRTVFKWAFESELIDRPVRMGQNFKRPVKSLLKAARDERGPLVLDAHEIRRLLRIAGQPMRAMILTGINCAFGNRDVSAVPFRAFDLPGGTVAFPRPKTKASRFCVLWPETVAAVREAIDTRAKPAAPEFADLVFLTRLGKPWMRFNEGEGKSWANFVFPEFRALLNAAGVTRPGVNFYTLRRMLETIGGETLDQVTVNDIMGHSISENDMAARYRQWIGRARSQHVVDHVRGWLFGSLSKDEAVILDALATGRSVQLEVAAAPVSRKLKSVGALLPAASRLLVGGRPMGGEEPAREAAQVCADLLWRGFVAVDGVGGDAAAVPAVKLLEGSAKGATLRTVQLTDAGRAWGSPSPSASGAAAIPPSLSPGPHTPAAPHAAGFGPGGFAGAGQPHGMPAGMAVGMPAGQSAATLAPIVFADAAFRSF